MGYVVITYGTRWLITEIESTDDVYTDPKERVLVVNGLKRQFQFNWDVIHVVSFADDAEDAVAVVKLLVDD